MWTQEWGEGISNEKINWGRTVWEDEKWGEYTLVKEKMEGIYFGEEKTGEEHTFEEEGAVDLHISLRVFFDVLIKGKKMSKL